MANLLPSFVSSGMVTIKINGRPAMYVQNLQVNQNVQHTPVGGIGSYGYHANEPVRINYSGSFSVVGYHKDIAQALKDADLAPANIQNSSKSKPNNDYKLIRKGHFNPLNMILTSTFDIEVLIRHNASKASNADSAILGQDDVSLDPTTDSTVTSAQTQFQSPIYTLKDCRFQGYQFGYTPGSLLNEGYSFVCNVIDYHGQNI